MKVRYVRKGETEYAVMPRVELDRLLDRIVTLRKEVSAVRRATPAPAAEPAPISASATAAPAAPARTKPVSSDQVRGVRDLRLALETTIFQLAAWAGISATRLEAIENDSRIMTEIESLRLARALGVPVDRLHRDN